MSITLSIAEVILLREFQHADRAFFSAQKALNDAEPGDKDYTGIVERYKNAYQERQNKATVFAMCVAASVGLASNHTKNTNPENPVNPVKETEQP